MHGSRGAWGQLQGAGGEGPRGAGGEARALAAGGGDGAGGVRGGDVPRRPPAAFLSPPLSPLRRWLRGWPPGAAPARAPGGGDGELLHPHTPHSKNPAPTHARLRTAAVEPDGRPLAAAGVEMPPVIYSSRNMQAAAEAHCCANEKHEVPTSGQGCVGGRGGGHRAEEVLAGRAGRGGGPARCQASPRKGEVRRSRGGLLLPALAAASRCRSSKFTAPPRSRARLRRAASHAPTTSYITLPLRAWQPHAFTSSNPPRPCTLIACTFSPAGTYAATPPPPFPLHPVRSNRQQNTCHAWLKGWPAAAASSQPPPGGAAGRGGGAHGGTVRRSVRRTGGDPTEAARGPAAPCTAGAQHAAAAGPPPRPTPLRPPPPLPLPCPVRGTLLAATTQGEEHAAPRMAPLASWQASQPRQAIPLHATAQS